LAGFKADHDSILAIERVAATLARVLAQSETSQSSASLEEGMQPLPVAALVAG
jgi:hypothetical protein